MSSVDAMAARLATSLAIAEGKRQIDLRPTHGQGLRQANVFLVGKLLTARDYKIKSFMGIFRNAWRINGALQVEEAEEQRVLFTLSDPADRMRVWRGAPWGYNHAPVALAWYDSIMPVAKVPLNMASYWITLQEIPSAFRSERVITMIGYTLGDFQKIDKNDKKAGKLRIRVEIPLNKPLPFKQWYLVEDEVEFRGKFRYDKLMGRCSTCGLVTHVGLLCSGSALDEDDDDAERTVLGSQGLPPEATGGMPMQGCHLLAPQATTGFLLVEFASGSMKKKRGRPTGSKNRSSSGDKTTASKHEEGHAQHKSPNRKQSVGKHSNSKGKEIVIV
ncbi:uncharacterized protein LOC133730708 [Rosa rugosa]|uniref:uncharacterized protein LOC133730708 n=1 Tax=Rosa rugosa TaxID=74645 RepID=UPI002B406B07|nr:uncharacterized protein LOC133730708 [Rosa rugosa]